MLTDSDIAHDRGAARLLGARCYRGSPCARCDARLRYTANGACVHCLAADGRRYKAGRIEQERERKRAWKRANPDKVRASKAAAYAPKREAARLRREVREADALAMRQAYGHAIEMARQERETNRPQRQRDLWRRMRSLRRARMRAAEGEFSLDQAALLLVLQGGQCAYCDAAERLTIDHMTPLSRGGSNRASNIQWLCKPHNDSKHARTDEAYRAAAGIDRETGAVDYARLLFSIMGD